MLGLAPALSVGLGLSREDRADEMGPMGFDTLADILTPMGFVRLAD